MNFYFITDRNLSKNGILEDVKQALEAGAGVIQYRDKDLSTRKMCEIGNEIRTLCTDHDALYIVNDRMDVALATRAHGVHLGQDDMELSAARGLMPQGIIGISCSTKEEAIHACGNGADYLGVGPVYSTSTKDDAGEAVGLDTLNEIRTITDIPLVAIGGITRERVQELILSGADLVAAISATIVGEDMYYVKEKVSEFIQETETCKSHGKCIRPGHDHE